MANQATTCRVNCIGSQAIVTLNNGSGQVNQTLTVRHVTVTHFKPEYLAQITVMSSPKSSANTQPLAFVPLIS